MNKFLIVLLPFLLISLNSFTQPWKDHGMLGISKENPHYFQFQDGTPFFWLGDTGWEMLHRLNREEIATYMENRKLKGFNVIQTVIISEFIHMDKQVNYYSDSIFYNENTESPAITPGNNPENEYEYDFWDHVDFAVNLAERNGLYVGLLPSWGEWFIPRSGKPLFNAGLQSYNYGWFLGNRYKKYPNIIWILGGDRQPDERQGGVELWRALAEGIADGVNGNPDFDGKADYTTTLMSHHAYNSSSTWFASDPWIDFHMWGSYHADVNNFRSVELALSDWNLKNPMPSLNSEPCYEGHGINYAIDDNGFFTSTDVRTAAYWSVFSGSAGFTYGAQPVWQFTDESRAKFSSKTIQNWQEGMDLPGSFQMQFLKKLMESGTMSDLKPDQSLILEGQGGCSDYICAIRGVSHAFVYIPTGNSVTIQLGILTGKKIKATWFNPRNGNITLIGEFDNSGVQKFEVPGMSKELNWLRSGRGCDWVLIIEDPTKSKIADLLLE